MTQAWQFLQLARAQMRALTVRRLGRGRRGGYELRDAPSAHFPRPAISRAALQSLFVSSAGVCAIPECPYPSQLESGIPLIEVAHISSPSPLGPRHDPTLGPSEANDISNLILLCPTHHRLIDDLSSKYTAEELKLLRDQRVQHVAKILAMAERPVLPTATAAASRVRQALQTWEQQRLNSREEYWHQLFEAWPELLGLVVHARSFVLKSKCYVGGKTIENSGGNILDFLAQHDGDVTLIEIKAPTSPLLGARYRANVYAPSQELVGAVVQALHYRLSLLNDLHALRSQSPGLEVHNPTVIVVIGDAEREIQAEEMKRRSFQLFRCTLEGVEIVTYDELFKGLANLMMLMEPPY